jgi:DNA adenine methylase
MKSFIRWAGSKRLLLPHLRGYWPSGARYVEPFCGSACLFFDLQPPRAILGDLNEELMLTFRAIRENPYVVLESLRRFPVGEAGYYRVRSLSPLSLAAAERAARFLYLNRYCFNGIYRTNQRGLFNVPYGPPRSGRPIEADTVLAAAKALNEAIVVHGDFEITLAKVRRGDFVYLDPPYCLEARRVFREYLPGSFTLNDLCRLSAQLERLHEIGSTFVVSYADSSEARRLLRPWRPRRVLVRRHIAGFSDRRRSSFELIASNRTIEGADN